MKLSIFSISIFSIFSALSNANANIYQVNSYYRGATYVRILPVGHSRVRIEKCDIGNEEASCKRIGSRLDYSIEELNSKYKSFKSISKWKWAIDGATVVTGVWAVTVAGGYLVAQTAIDGAIATGNEMYKSTAGNTQTPEVRKSVKGLDDSFDPLEVSRIAETISPEIVQRRDQVTLELDKFIARMTVALSEIDGIELE